MLFLLHRGNHPNVTYRGGQAPIVHLESDLYAAVAWAERNGRQWAFTLSNAGASYFENRCHLEQLSDINWEAVQTNKWSGLGISGLIKEGKQAEFLLERSFPWFLVERIGVLGQGTGGCPAFLLNIEKRSPPRLMLSGDGLASKDAV
jgi:hypothetical protein